MQVLPVSLAAVCLSAAGSFAAQEAAQQAPDGWKMQLAVFLNTKWGQYAMIAVFFLLIIGYLRFLFGPGGILREKKWDEWNEQARKEREKAQKDGSGTRRRPDGLFYRGRD